MSSTKRDGGPAFPAAVETSRLGFVMYRGMSLRDYFAAAVLQGSIAACQINPDADPKKISQFLLQMVSGCYEVADAMLKERDSK